MIPNSGTWRNQRCGRPISEVKDLRNWFASMQEELQMPCCVPIFLPYYSCMHTCFSTPICLQKKANKLIIANQKRKIQTNLLSTQKLRKRDFQVQLSHPFLPEMCCHLSLFHWLNSDPALKHVTITNYNRSPVTVMIWDIAVTCNLQCFGICSSHRTSWEY